jgi:hypothetical protein
MPEIFNVIQNQSINLVNNIRINLGRAGMFVTNKTQQSLRQEVKQEGTKYTVQVFGRPFFMTVQTGRRPTPDKKPSREMVENIREWMDARGIDESAAWAIATNINKKGTRLWREGGRTDIVDPAVDTFVNDVGQAFLEAEAENFSIRVRTMKWQ